jgi:2-C-methyl-D-erythritol 2,4-cyclodiphosphate synthase
MTGMRIGHGFDTHALVPERELVLGGIVIPHDRGLEGHSDGDVLLHAVTSALLGAMGEGDLGVHFPSSDPALRGIASRELVARAVGIMRERGLALGNLDATLVAQVPRLAPHLEKMRAAIADLLGAPADRVNVKATSTDHLGHLGRGEGIAAFAVVLLEPAL